MKSLSAILFLVGIPWALIAWIGVLCGPYVASGAFVESRFHAPRSGAAVDIVVLLLISAQGVSGYVIWTRWLRIATGKRDASPRFWILAALHHLIWMICAGPLTWADPSLSIFYYSSAVFLACVASAVASRRGKRPDRSKDTVMTPLGV